MKHIYRPGDKVRINDELKYSNLIADYMLDLRGKVCTIKSVHNDPPTHVRLEECHAGVRYYAFNVKDMVPVFENCIYANASITVYPNGGIKV